MNIERCIQGSLAILRVNGRLDASWADHFYGAVQGVLRDGCQQVRVEAEKLEYLSSAGIRVLLKARRDIAAVNGSFGIIGATVFVAETLRLSGLEILLLSTGGDPSCPLPQSPPPEGPAPHVSETAGMEIEDHVLLQGGRIACRAFGGWLPWRTVSPGDIVPMEFPGTRFGLGIGAAAQDAEDARGRFGDFVAAAGCLCWLPGDHADQPDYLEQADRFVPKIHAIQALVGHGAFAHLLRFRSLEKDISLPISGLYDHVLRTTRSNSAALVMLAEVEGLVGACLARSPGLIRPGDQPGAFPEVRSWLAYCGDRLHRQALVLLVAFVSRQPGPGLAPYLVELPSRPDIHAHAHAVVLPFRALARGVLELETTVRAVFEDAAPVALLHLLHDDRPALGLGESAFVRGACWCAPMDDATEGGL